MTNRIMQYNLQNSKNFQELMVMALRQGDLRNALKFNRELYQQEFNYYMTCSRKEKAKVARQLDIVSSIGEEIIEIFYDQLNTNGGTA